MTRMLVFGVMPADRLPSFLPSSSSFSGSAFILSSRIVQAESHMPDETPPKGLGVGGPNSLVLLIIFIDWRITHVLLVGHLSEGKLDTGYWILKEESSEHVSGAASSSGIRMNNPTTSFSISRYASPGRRSCFRFS